MYNKRGVRRIMMSGAVLVLFLCALCNLHCRAADMQMPTVALVSQGEETVCSVSTDAPQYLLEWDTDSRFTHKEAFALYRGRNYDAYLMDSRKEKVTLRFPKKSGVYYIRAYGVYSDGKGGYVLSKASKQCKVIFTENSKRQSRKMPRTDKKLKMPGLKAQYVKKLNCLKLTLMLPEGTRGYMLETSSKKSFSYKKAYPLYEDTGDYMVLWNPAVTKRKQTLYIPISEFRGNHVYVRLYAMGDVDDNGTNILSAPSQIKKVCWKR